MTIRLAALGWMLALFLGQPYAQTTAPAPAGATPVHADVAFQTSGECVACHNGLTTPAGEDVSIGTAWRASMMANSSRDPYWQASVRRETIDHPSEAAGIEHECATCHMPMSSAIARAGDRQARVFAHLEGGDEAQDRLAKDGVSCTLCHQISADGLGTPESFSGRFVIAGSPSGERRMLGPFEIDAGRTGIMRSATGATPAEANHVRQSELCASCHTLYTTALGPNGEVIGRLPEQMPYLEWRNSAFREARSCQSCHMPVVTERTRIASVLGELREGLGRHTFLGGNFFMLRMLNRYRAELGVAALPRELEAAAAATMRQLQTETATAAVTRSSRSGNRLDIDVDVRNLTGHKLPTAYPARRAWLHVAVRDADGRVMFESGAVTPAGLIAGNDNDEDGARYEPHYDSISRPDQVQIYESIMADGTGAVTTGLLQALTFVKDNRLLPRGFDKARAEADIAVRGGAFDDDDFRGEGDRVSYAVDVTGGRGPFVVEVELRYQPIAFRWAENLRRYDAREPARFVSFFTAMADSSSAVLSRASARAE